MSTISPALGAPVQTATLPPPLVKPWRHPLRWTAQNIQLAIYLVVGATLGVYMVAGFYYLLLETTPTMNNWWHHTVPNSETRHAYRNVGEGLLGALLGITVVWNHFKPKVQRRLRKPPNLLDRIEIALHIPNVKDNRDFSPWQMIMMPFLVLVYAAPGFWVGLKIVDFLHHHSLHVAVPFSTNPSTATLAEKFQATWTQDWPKKLVGYFAAFCFGRRPAKGVIDDMQLLFASRRAALGKPPRWYHPAPFKARYNQVVASGNTDAKVGKFLPVAVSIGMAVGFGLMCVGFYVLMFIAK